MSQSIGWQLARPFLFPASQATLVAMSQAASQAHAFYRQVAETHVLWTIRRAEQGPPAPISISGKRVQPFWSSRSRVERIIAGVPAFEGFEPVEVTWAEFEQDWAPRLRKEGILAGVNWSGKRAVGFDLDPDFLIKAVYGAMGKEPPRKGILRRMRSWLNDNSP